MRLEFAGSPRLLHSLINSSHKEQRFTDIVPIKSRLRRQPHCNLLLLESVFDPAKISQGCPEVEVRHGDVRPDGDCGLIVASAVSGILLVDQEIAQEEVGVKIHGVRSLHALQKTDCIPLLVVDLPRDNHQESYGLVLDRRRPGKLFERMLIVPQFGIANPPAGWVRLNLPRDLGQPVAPVFITPGPIVEPGEEDRRDARRSNPRSYDRGVGGPVPHSRLPECRFIGGDGPRHPNGVPLRLKMAVADFLQLPDHGQFAVRLARPAAKDLGTAVAKPALGPLERVAGVAPLLPLFRISHVVEICLDHARQHAPIHQHRHNHGDKPIQEQNPAENGHGERAMAPGPLEDSFDRAGTAGQDRLAPQEPQQIAGKFSGRAVSPRGLLGQALQADRLKVH